MSYIDQERLVVLEDYFRRLLQDNRIQGANYIVSKDGTIVAEQAMGNRTCREGSDAIAVDAIGEIYELTMTFTAAAIMQLIERGMITLHQPVADVISEFDHPYFRSISIYQLLTHTSGLVANTSVMGDVYAYPYFEWHPTFKGDWLQTILSFPLTNEPGERHVQSFAGYAVLGAVIERLTGQRYERYIEQFILQPLGMHDTFFDVPDDKRHRVHYSFDWQEGFINDAGDTRMPRAIRGMFASLKDVLRFANMLLNGGTLDDVRFLSSRSVELMTTNRLTGVKELSSGKESDSANIGLGWLIADGIGEPLTAGTYWQGNSISSLYVDPKERMVYAFQVPHYTWDSEMTNTRPRAIVWSALKNESVIPPRNDNDIRESFQHSGDHVGLHLRELVDKQILQGASYLLARSGQVSYKDAFGKRVYNDQSTSIDSDSIWLVTSLHKLITVLAVMQLVEDGKLWLTQPVKKYIPEFDTKLHNEIQIFHLLEHTSGIAPEPGSLGEPYPNGWWEYRNYHEGERTWVKAALSGPLHGKLGRTKLYSTAGYLILGEIISSIAGVPYEQFVQERILQPLGMNSTFFNVPNELRNRVVVADEWQEMQLNSTQKTVGQPPRSGSGIYSTLDDLYKLGTVLLNGGLVGEREHFIGKGAFELLERNRWFDVPGLSWSDAPEERFPFPTASYPIKQLKFPVLFFHDIGVSAGLLLNREEHKVAVVVMPTSVDWSPEPLIQARNIISLLQ